MRNNRRKKVTYFQREPKIFRKIKVILSAYHQNLNSFSQRFLILCFPEKSDNILKRDSYKEFGGEDPNLRTKSPSFL